MLRDKHVTLSARFAPFQGVECVAEYAPGYIAEYDATKQAVGLMDRSYCGRIELSGTDRLDFLQRMTTNDVHNLSVGSGLQTVLTTPEAKIVELLTIYVKADSLLCLTSPQNALGVFNWFKRHIFFRDKVKPVNVSEQTAQLSLFGPRAHEVAEKFAQQTIIPLPSFHSQLLTVGDMHVLLASVPQVAGGGYDLICPHEQGERLWDTLMECGSPLDLQPMGALTFNLLRVEASQPLYGYELTEEYNPLEARLNDVISFSKGCYTGQEIIARLDTYQKLKHILIGFRLSELPRNALPLSFKIDGVGAGRLTSVVRLPNTHGVLGLGYVRVKMNQVGAAIELQDGDEIVRGMLVSLPFDLGAA